GLAPAYSEEDIQKFASGKYPYNYPNTDWIKLIFQGSGFTQNHDLSFSGGSERSQYRVSLAYYQQDGLMKKTNTKRYNVRINLSNQMTDWLKSGINVGLSQQRTTNPTAAGESFGGIISTANRIPPTVVNRFPDGSWGQIFGKNPIAYVEDGGE